MDKADRDALRKLHKEAIPCMVEVGGRVHATVNPEKLPEFHNNIDQTLPSLLDRIDELEDLVYRLHKAIPHSLCYDAAAYAEAEAISETFESREECAKCGKFPGTIIEAVGDLKFETPIKKFSAIKSGDRYLCFSCLDDLMNEHGVKWTDPSTITPLFTIAIDHALGNTTLCPYHENSLGWDECTDLFEGCEIARVREILENPDSVNNIQSHAPGT